MGFQIWCLICDQQHPGGVCPLGEPRPLQSYELGAAGEAEAHRKTLAELAEVRHELERARAETAAVRLDLATLEFALNAEVVRAVEASGRAEKSEAEVERLQAELAELRTRSEDAEAELRALEDERSRHRGRWPKGVG